MEIEVTATTDPREALGEARPHLEARPVEHNLVLTLLGQRVDHPEPGRYWIARRGGEVVGVAFLSPLWFSVTLTPMAPPVVDAVVDRIVSDGMDPLGVSGEAATAARAAGQWTERTGVAARPEMGMRIYRLGELVPPEGVTGRLRTATADDRDTVLEMIAGFERDVGQPSVLAPAVHDERLARGVYVLWEDRGPVSLAARTEPLAGMSRVSAVYTPPERRRRGYAAAAVAELSGWIRADGADAMLFTDLANPTSNSVYRRIGYRAVAENLQYRFSDAATPGG